MVLTALPQHPDMDVAERREIWQNVLRCRLWLALLGAGSAGMDGRQPRSVRKVPARHADNSRNNSSGGAACRGAVRFCGRARIETIVAETGRLGEKRAPDGLWIFI
jgi:hypothetical protein